MPRHRGAPRRGPALRTPPPPPLRGLRPSFDLVGAVLSVVGLFFVVFGVLQSGTYGWGAAKQSFTVHGAELIPEGCISPVWVLVTIGGVFLVGFACTSGCANGADTRRWCRPPSCATAPRTLRNRTSNLGLGTQIVQWLVLQGWIRVISVFLQQERGISAIWTGLMLLPATIGILLLSTRAPQMASRHPQRLLIRAGFTLTVGLGTLLALEHLRGLPESFEPRSSLGVAIASSGLVGAAERGDRALRHRHRGGRGVRWSAGSPLCCSPARPHPTTARRLRREATAAGQLRAPGTGRANSSSVIARSPRSARTLTAVIRWVAG